MSENQQTLPVNLAPHEIKVLAEYHSRSAWQVLSAIGDYQDKPEGVKLLAVIAISECERAIYLRDLLK